MLKSFLISKIIYLFSLLYLITDLLLDFDDGEVLQLLVVDHMVQLRRQHAHTVCIQTYKTKHINSLGMYRYARFQTGGLTSVSKRLFSRSLVHCNTGVYKVHYPFGTNFKL